MNLDILTPLSAVTLQRMTADVSVCSYAPIRSHMQLYIRGTVCKACVENTLNTLTYVGVSCVIRRGEMTFLDMFKIYQHMQAYSLYVTHTLGICFIW